MLLVVIVRMGVGSQYNPLRYLICIAGFPVSSCLHSPQFPFLPYPLSIATVTYLSSPLVPQFPPFPYSINLLPIA